MDLTWPRKYPVKGPDGEYPGQKAGLPRPGSPEWVEYHRRVWEKEHPEECRPSSPSESSVPPGRRRA